MLAQILESELLTELSDQQQQIVTGGQVYNDFGGSDFYSGFGSYYGGFSGYSASSISVGSYGGFDW